MNKTHTKPVIKTIALSLALVLLASTLLLIPAEAADTSSMGALVDTFTANTSTFTLSTTSRFFVVASSAPSGDLLQTVQLSQRQFAADGFPSTTVMPIVWGDEAMALAGDIVVKLNASSGIAAEGYTLNVTNKAVVTASDVDGLLYGLNMLQKHFRVADDNAIKGFTSADAPDTKERTVSLDFARKYYSKDWICNFIREISWMGYNTLQLHLGEDSGFRMDIWDDTYYEGQFQPKNDFTWICGSEYAYYINLFSPSGVVVDDPDADKYLTCAEMIEILQTAKEYHLDIIPSFDSPGHMDYLNWKYEQNYLSHNNYSFVSTKYNKTYYAKDISGVINYTNVTSAAKPGRAKPYFKAVNVNNEQAKAFVMELYTDLANFFKEYAGSTDFSICADEVVLDDYVYITNSAGTNVKTYFGDTWAFDYDDFVDYVNELHTYLSGKGYTVRAYNDFVGTTKHTTTKTFPSNMEIMYWTSPYNPGSTATNKYTESIQPVSYFADKNYKVYNCIQTHTYYAQAFSSSLTNKHPDCRCTSNTSWTMGYATEDKIFDYWYPADFTERGYYGEESQKLVSADKVAGAYYLIWSDNPALSTKEEIWNGFYGCQDTSGNAHLYINLMDRMWSNIIKMWNWDVNTTTYNGSKLTFAGYKTLRDDFKNLSDVSSDPSAFPGMDSTKGTSACSSAAVLPAATAPTQITSQSTLSSAIGTKLAKGVYTDASYSAYSTAYDAAQAAATDTSMTAAEQATYTTLLNNYNTAYAGLTLKTFTVTVNHYAQNTTTAVKPSETLTTTSSSNHYELEVTNLSNYVVASVSGSSYTSTSSGVTLYGDATANTTITVYYKEIVDTTALNALIATGNSLSSTYYTDDSWTAYSTALSNAKTVAANESATQAQVDAAADALQAAFDALVTTGDPKVTPLSVELLSTTVPMGKQVGLRIISDPSVETLSITCNGVEEKQIFCSSQVQKLADNDIVRIWLVFIDADTAGTFTYTINGTVNVTVTVV